MINFTKLSYIFLLLFLILYKIHEANLSLIHNYENNSIDINSIKAMKKVVYTALLGNYDKIKIINKEKGYDYIMFTDQNLNNKRTNWTIINVEHNLNYSNKLEVIKKQRFYKIYPHLFFKDYNLSIYIDSTFDIKGKLDEFLLRILTKNLSIYILEHPDRNSINKEFEAVLSLKKESKTNIEFIKKRYNLEEYPYNNGLSENCLIVRKHNDLNSINLMNQWFYEIKHYSHRDQLSFNYIIWKTNNTKVKYISKEMLYEYFQQNLTHLISIEFKNN